MKRVAFKMKMTPGMKEEYIKRHDQIWPEIAELIKKKRSQRLFHFFG
jgi:L-rhamnose mutarotase